MREKVEETKELVASRKKQRTHKNELSVDEDFQYSPKDVGYDDKVFDFGVTQDDINSYVAKSYQKDNEKSYIKFLEASSDLIQAISSDVNISGYFHALRDNDIRHIRNSHGEATNEKYPVTQTDIQMIPFIIENYDKVFYKTNANGAPGLVFVKVMPKNVIYYVEAITMEYGEEKLLVNKQMLKTGISEIPNLVGLIDAINKKESSSQYLADLEKIRKAYVQDVKENYSYNRVPDSSAKINDEIVNISDDEQLSEKRTESVYDLMGENKRLAEGKAKLTEDVSRLKELLKLEKTVTNGKYAKNSTLLSAASIIRKQAHSNYDKVALAKQIGTLYTDIFEDSTMSSQDILDRIKAIAEDVVSEAKTEKQIDYGIKRILGEIKNTRVSLDEKQIAEMEYRFGKDWRKRFFNRIIINQDAISLDSKWKEWSDPESPLSAYFDADINSADQIGALYDLIDTLREATERVIEYDYAEQVNSVAEDIWNQFWNIVPYESTADKYTKKIAELKSKHKQMMSDLRSKRNAREKEKLKTQKTLDALCAAIAWFSLYKRLCTDYGT